MARSTVGKLASKTAAVAKRVTAGAAKKATPTKKASAAGKAAPAKKTPAKKTPAKKAPAKSSAAVKKTTAPAKKTSTAQKAAAAKKTAPVKKSAAAKKSAPAKKATPVKKSAPAKKATPAKKSAPVKKAAPVKKSAPAKKAPAKRASRKTVQARSTEHASSLAVKADENPWTPAELDEVRTGLTADADRLRGELDLAARELDDLMRDAGDGAGNDQADVGSTTFERDHEMSLANNARDMLTQTEHALERIADGSYGRCESCGQPIGKNRLMAFPRATLCLTCKQKEERR